MSLTVVPSTHISVDERGVAWIGSTNVKVKEIVLDALAGESVPEIADEHPYLTRAQIHAALAFYYDHKEQLEAQIRADTAFADAFFGDLERSNRQQAVAAKVARARNSQ